MKKGIGLCGSHRSGKTTMAAKIGERSGLMFLQTTTSEVFARNGLDPSAPMDFPTRIWIQHKVVEAAEAVWQSASAAFVSDRTPIDMMAYTLADIQGATEVDFAELEGYLEHCFQATNRFFCGLAVIQPAIPLVHAEGKAALNRAYMEHLNVLIKGLCCDERLRCPVKFIDRGTLDLDERVAEVLRMVADG
ncbi:MAG: AAA family ATPase [Deltaproteobacteria bacterium]|nr:AAA family ATPase [Deltaproteobacteria bacterium]